MTKTRIHVGNDPYVVRTAVQSFLAADPRFEAILVPAGDSCLNTGENDIIVVSTPGSYEARIVVRLLENEVEICADGVTTTLAYEGLPWLAQTLLGLIQNDDEGDQTHDP